MVRPGGPSCSARVVSATVSEQSSAQTDAEHARFVEQLFDRYRESLMRYLSTLLPRRVDAEDVLQETYARLLAAKQLDRTAASRARAYAFKIATHLAYDRLRRPYEETLDDATDTGRLSSAHDEPESILDLARAAQVVESTLLELKPRCRRVFLLRAAEELGYDTIAAALGVS
jgi:RNA polymerase sigma factor (sigma-70 family)